jgi:hypothetical protein
MTDGKEGWMMEYDYSRNHARLDIRKAWWDHFKVAAASAAQIVLNQGKTIFDPLFPEMINKELEGMKCEPMEGE